MKHLFLIFFSIFFGICLNFSLTGFTMPLTGQKIDSQNSAAAKPDTAKPDTAKFGAPDSDQAVTKHIFLPEAYINKKGGLNGEDEPLPRAFQIAKRQLVFSGVISDGHGRKALILDKNPQDPRQRGKSRIFKKGDTIMNGLSIKDVGPNFVVLASQDKTMQFNLYQGGKIRPKPINTIKLPKVNTGKQQTKTGVHSAGGKKAGTQARIGKSGMTTANGSRAKSGVRQAAKSGLPFNMNGKSRSSVNRGKTFADAIRNALGGKIHSSGNNNTVSKSTNPFLEAIRRAKQAK